MEQAQRSRIVSGVTLVVLGLALFGLQYVDGIGHSVILFLVGALGVAGYLFRGSFALLVIGGILMGLGLGSIGENKLSYTGDFKHIGLGVGFLSIYVIALVHRGRAHWWPLIPGVLLVLSGVFTRRRVFDFVFSSRGWPLIIVFIGALFVLGALGRPRGQKGT